ncbi:EscN/YscN/HrcN family type III secretion system ATPase [Cellvibrio zantedeschiae]|uniref:protein-secreting ATPase n=1 Tax=Cellvibrio zantedeschiae TaxID=1237077 RepID=A0ABQ3B8N3_9GAMM|nr:FliI/YscN family ATPase [Cellvibrio zantedeschiae]GGY84912.1 EscN/YscN/HrcN family type III secretion system ATPase [Cellvibrio zantedeschiae]
MNYSFLSKAIDSAVVFKQFGTLLSINGPVIEATGCKVQHGELVKIVQPSSGNSIFAEVIGLREHKILLMPYNGIDGLCLESIVEPLGDFFSVPVGHKLLGRVIDPLGNALDDKGDIDVSQRRSSHGSSINPLNRKPITEMLSTGIKAIDIFTPIGKGQRVGIFAGSGVGKSTLLGMIAKFSVAEVIVIALIGERGREVGDFIRDNLGDEGLRKTVLVVATAAEPAVLRRQAAYTATAIAEWFRSEGQDVLLIMDSITRFAMAQREIGLAAGEPLGARGYPPSALSLLPPLVERAGNIYEQGSLSAVYTVLVEGDDFNEPISDHMRSVLDGHIILDRAIAARGQYPAIDILNSISRLAKFISDKDEISDAAFLRTLISNYQEAKDLIDLGLHKEGHNKVTDLAVKMKQSIDQLLQQTEYTICDRKELRKLVIEIIKKAKEFESANK